MSLTSSTTIMSSLLHDSSSSRSTTPTPFKFTPPNYASLLASELANYPDSAQLVKNISGILGASQEALKDTHRIHDFHIALRIRSALLFLTNGLTEVGITPIIPLIASTSQLPSLLRDEDTPIDDATPAAPAATTAPPPQRPSLPKANLPKARSKPSASVTTPVPTAPHRGDAGRASGGVGVAKGKVVKAVNYASAPSPPSQPSYAAAAKLPKPSPRPSLVLSLSQSQLSLRGAADIKPHVLVPLCNEALSKSPGHANVRISAARWSPKGNLVVSAGPDNTPLQLQLAAPVLTSYLQSRLSGPGHITSRPNVRWSKIIINSVPTGVTTDTAAHTSVACHQALLFDNPSYRALKVTQLPSWVKPPSSYPADSSSSLSVAFEDPDGSIATSLIAARHLFIFGAQATIRKWRQPPGRPAALKRATAQSDP